VIVFGSLSSSRVWAYEWQFNDLSWAFAVAVVGVILLHLAGVLFLMEACCQYRWKLGHRLQGRYSLTGLQGQGQGQPYRLPSMGEKGVEEAPAAALGEGRRRLSFVEALDPRPVVSKFTSKLRDRFSTTSMTTPTTSVGGAAAGSAKAREALHEEDERETSVDGMIDDTTLRIGDSRQSRTFQRFKEPSPELSLRDSPPSSVMDMTMGGGGGPSSSSRVSPSIRQPVPTPRSPTQAEMTREALENILQSHSGGFPPRADSPPDSGISVTLPFGKKQMITSTLFSRFGAGSKAGGGQQQQQQPPPPPPPIPAQPPPTMEPMTPPPSSEEEVERFVGEGYEEEDGPPRVRRPSGRRLRSHPPHQQQPLSVQTLMERQQQEQPSAPTMQSLLRPATTISRPQPPPPLPIPPPPPLSPPPRTTTPSSHTITYANIMREIQSSRSTTTTDAPQSAATTTAIHLPSISRSIPPVGAKVPEGSAPPAPHHGEFGLPPPEEAPSGGRTRPPSAASAVAQILASRQPLSLRIHIQKHKTETSYKKSQSQVGGGKKGADGYSESSI
jgi:hypothetical protein